MTTKTFLHEELASLVQSKDETGCSGNRLQRNTRDTAAASPRNRTYFPKKVIWTAG